MSARLVALIEQARASAVAYRDANLPPPPPPPPPPGGGFVVALDLEFGHAGRLPWAFGHQFKRGDYPADSTLVGDCAEFQSTPWAFFDDGSVRFAMLAGYCDIPAPGRVSVRLSVVASPPPVLTWVPPVPADVQVSVDGAVPPISARRLVHLGPVMAQEQVVHRVDQQVAIVYEVRHFRGGEKEVSFPAIENCGFLAGQQPARPLAVRAVVGGVLRFDETLDAKHHTRNPALRGSSWTTWIGADPQVLPWVDRAYWCACESVPPYTPTAARASLFTDRHPAGHPRAGKLVIRQDFEPAYVGEDGPAMASGGYGAHIGLLARHNIYPLTTGGRGAWDYMWTEALASGSWSIHFREEGSGRLPLPATWPTHTWQSNIPMGSGGENGAADLAHQPSSVYVAAILTGWRWFIDEAASWVVYNHFYQQPPIRQDAKGILRTDVGTNQDRGAAWSLRSLAQAIALLPPSDPLQPALVAIWGANMAYYRARFVDGTIEGGIHRNALGVMAPYSSSGTSLYAGGDRGTSLAWWGAGWMQSMITQSLGQALQLRLPVAPQVQADTRAVFEFSAKLIVGLCGDGSPGSFDWRRFGVYAMPFWPDGLQRTPGAYYPDFGQVLAEYERAKGLGPATGTGVKRHSTNLDIDGAYWQTGMVSYHWPALVYAVMHGAPGAAAAFARVQGSSSWPFLAAGVENPIWAGMIPPGVKHPGA